MLSHIHSDSSAANCGSMAQLALLCLHRVQHCSCRADLVHTFTLSRSSLVSCMSRAEALCCACTANRRLHLAEQLEDAAATAVAARNIRASSVHDKAIAVQTVTVKDLSIKCWSSTKTAEDGHAGGTRIKQS
jgi:hypothetical protein